jgi:hypothetical protein
MKGSTKMKKLLRLFVSVFMFFGLAACSLLSKTTTTITQKPTTTTTQKPTTTTTSQTTTTTTTSQTTTTTTTSQTTTTTQKPTTTTTTTIKPTTTTNNGETSIRDQFPCITIEEAIEIARQAGSSETSEKYYIYGTIKSISNPTYGEMTITDGTNDLYVYGSTNEAGDFYSKLEDKPVKGDEIVLYGGLKVYNDTPEMGRSVIKAFEHAKIEIDLTNFPLKSIAEARNLEKEANCSVKGTVAFITMANGYIPDGFFVVDNTSAIYVYGEAAQQVKVGNIVTVAGTKDYFVAQNEQANAQTFGYKGASQLKNATLIENDNKVNNIDFSFAEEKTVKEIINTSFSEDITSQVYKVTALVKKVPGDGFVNYYIDDLDGITGSYVYTKCNGGDYEWLDEFDGKICTVYLSAINAKSTATGCNWRFIPVGVVDENFKFNEQNAPEYAIEYHAKDQFKLEYTADPTLELITSVSSELLEFEDVQLEYLSDNTEVVYFETIDNKVVLHTKNEGSAKITIKATYKTYTAEYKFDVTVKAPVSYEYTDVKTAIEAEDGTTVTVKGVVTSGVTNKPSGFYLTDASGIIAVQLKDAAQIAEIKIGDMVIIEGIRTYNENKGAKTPQIVINEAKVLVNEFGNHEHSTDSFEEITAETLVEAKDYSTAKGYIVEGVISKGGNAYYTNFYFGYGTTQGTNLQIYAASGAQLSFLDEFVGQTVTLEVLYNDWNNKGARLYVVAVRTADGKVINNINFK